MAWKSYNTTNITQKYLYKFLSLKHLQNFLESGTIWFSRADIFGDKMECVFISDLESPSPDFKNIEKRKQQYLISCWHLATYESLALWDTYSDTVEKRRTVAIRFKREDLLEFMNDRFHSNDTFHYQTEFIQGKVTYKNLIGTKRELLKQQTVLYPSFRKEIAFKYEQEYRFVIKLKTPFPQPGIYYKIGNPSTIRFEILVNPLLNKNDYSKEIEKIEKVGFRESIVTSELAKWLKPDLW